MNNKCRYWHDKYYELANMFHRVIYEVDDYCKDWRLIQQAKNMLGEIDDGND